MEKYLSMDSVPEVHDIRPDWFLHEDGSRLWVSEDGYGGKFVKDGGGRGERYFDAKEPEWLSPGELWERGEQDFGQYWDDGDYKWNGYWWRKIEDHSSEWAEIQENMNKTDK